MFKLPEAAQRLGVSIDTARRYVRNEDLPSVFIGGAYRISEEDLDAFIESRRGAHPKANAPSESRDELEAWGKHFAVALKGAALLPEDPDRPGILPDVLGAMIALLKEEDAEKFYGLACMPLMKDALETAQDRLLGIVLEDELRQGLSEQAAEMQQALERDA